MIVATANKLARISWAVLSSGNGCTPPLSVSARRSGAQVRFSEVCRRIGRTKTQSNGVPENLRRNKVSHNRSDYQARARADHHHAPGDHSPLEAGYIFADCFSSNPIPLAVRRRTIHFFNNHAENPIQSVNSDTIRQLGVDQVPSRIVPFIGGSRAKAQTEQGRAAHRTTADS
jgi:hypothetical protein